jgi:hypothetical protein
VGESSDRPVNCLRENWQRACRQKSAAVALLAPGCSPLTYGQWGAQVDYVGLALRSFGVPRAGRVAVVLPNGADTAIRVFDASQSNRASSLPHLPTGHRKEFISDRHRGGSIHLSCAPTAPTLTNKLSARCHHPSIAGTWRRGADPPSTEGAGCATLISYRYMLRLRTPIGRHNGGVADSPRDIGSRYLPTDDDDELSLEINLIVETIQISCPAPSLGVPIANRTGDGNRHALL